MGILATWLDRRTERMWRDVNSVEDLGELVAQFCEGKLDWWPGHLGPRDPETVEIADSLAHANRFGFITTCSQPGCDLDAHGWQQRAAVTGYASPDVVAELFALMAPTRLQITTRRCRRLRRTDCSVAVPVTTTNGKPYTWFGAHLNRRAVAFEFDGIASDVVDELIEMDQVTVVDPEWGDHDLLWRRLAKLRGR